MIEGGHVLLILFIRIEGHPVLVEECMGVKPTGQPQELTYLQQREASLAYSCTAKSSSTQRGSSSCWYCAAMSSGR